MIAISTPRLTLRPFTPADAPEIFAAISPEVARFMSWDPPLSAEDFADVWRAWVPAMEAGQEWTFVVRSGPEFVGVAGLHGLTGDSAEAGIWLKEAAQGRGFGYEAVQGLLDWATQAMGFDEFQWPVARDNLRSRSLAEKLGGTIVGEFHSAKYPGVMYRLTGRPGDLAT